MNRIAKRYAQALLQISMESSSIHSFEEDLKGCVDTIWGNHELFEVLHNPKNSTVMRIGILDSLFSSHISKDVLNLLKLLIDKRRFEILPYLYAAYRREAQNYTRALDVTVISALPLDPGELEKIKTKIIEQYNVSAANMNPQIDASLIGGFKLIIGNEIIDNSIKAMLNAMKNQVLSR